MRGVPGRRARQAGGRRASLLEHIARAYLAGSPDRIPEAKGAKPPYQIVLHSHPATGLTWCEPVDGERYIDSLTIEKALCDAEIIETGDANAFPISDTETRSLDKGHSGDNKGMARVSPTVGLLETCLGENCRENHSGEHSLMAFVNSLYAQYKGRESSPFQVTRRMGSSGEKGTFLMPPHDNTLPALSLINSRVSLSTTQ